MVDNKEVNFQELKNAIEDNNKLCVVLFYAPIRKKVVAEAKRIFKSVVEHINAEGFKDQLDFLQVDVTKNSKTLDEFKLKIDLTIVIFSGMKEVARKEGLIAESVLKKTVFEFIPF